MFDITQRDNRAFECLKACDIKRYYEVILGIDHYRIYFDSDNRGSGLAYDWFVEHL